MKQKVTAANITRAIRGAVLLFLLLGGPAVLHAQHTVQGVFTGDGKTPVAGANISIDSVTKTNLFSAGTDSIGRFTVKKIHRGQYTLTVSHAAYKKYTVPLVITGDTFITATLTPEFRTSEMANVVQPKPVFERKTDRFVFFPANSAITLGNNVWDVLSQTPTVQAGDLGGLTVLGNPQPVTVYINRQRFSLTGDDLIQFLKTMPADNIIRIEILTIPPPSYDAEGPVIDLVLRKYIANGLKGSASTSFTRASVARGSASLNLDFNHNWYNQTFFISGSGGRSFQEIDKQTSFKNSPSAVASALSLKGINKAVNAYTDIRFALNPVLSAGTQWLINASNGESDGVGSEAVKPADTYTVFNQDISRNSTLVSGNVFLKYYSEKKKEYFEISSDLLQVNSNQHSEFLANINGGNIKTVVPQHIKNTAVKIDFSKTIKKTSFETGVKWGRSNIQTPYEAFMLNSGLWQKINALSANFNYREDVFAFYGSAERALSAKLSAKIGFRLENTAIKTSTVAAGNANNKSAYLLFFPVGYINYTPSQKHFFSLTSRTGNNRPEYYTLNPARILLGIRTITEGNPYLTPSGGGVVEFMYGYKAKYYIGLNYTRNNRLFSQVNEVLPPDTILVKWQNWGNQQQYNLWYYSSHEFFKRKWTVVLSSVFSYNRRLLSGSIEHDERYLNNNQFTFTFNNSFNNVFLKNLRLYCNTSFALPQRYGLWLQDETFRVDIGGSYLFKRKWRLSMALNDIFKYNDRNAYMTNETSQQLTRALTNNDSRSIRISLSKSFGNTKTRTINKRETSNEEEKQRAN